MNFYQRVGILPLKKRINCNKCSFTTKQCMFGVFSIDEILRYRWTRFVGSRTLCHPAHGCIYNWFSVIQTVVCFSLSAKKKYSLYVSHSDSFCTSKINISCFKCSNASSASHAQIEMEFSFLNWNCHYKITTNQNKSLGPFTFFARVKMYISHLVTWSLQPYSSPARKGFGEKEEKSKCRGRECFLWETVLLQSRPEFRNPNWRMFHSKE